jgi:hypothetical protein
VEDGGKGEQMPRLEHRGIKVKDIPKKWYQKNAAALIGATGTILAALIGLAAVFMNSPKAMPTRSPVLPESKPSPSLAQCYKYDAKEQVLNFKIRPNMTASNLSRLFAVPVSDILAACGAGAGGVLVAGSECKISMLGWRVASYEVQKGDTAFSLERRFGLARGSPILEWNCLDSLRTGQLIQIFLPAASVENATDP